MWIRPLEVGAVVDQELDDIDATCARRMMERTCAFVDVHRESAIDEHRHGMPPPT
jgi:hypothetical protein